MVTPDTPGRGSLNELLDQFAGLQLQYSLVQEDVRSLTSMIARLRQTLNDPRQMQLGIEIQRVKN